MNNRLQCLQIYIVLKEDKLRPGSIKQHNHRFTDKQLLASKGKNFVVSNGLKVLYLVVAGIVYQVSASAAASSRARRPGRGDPPRRARGEPPSWHIGSITNRSSVKVNTRDINQYRPGGSLARKWMCPLPLTSSTPTSCRPRTFRQGFSIPAGGMDGGGAPASRRKTASRRRRRRGISVGPWVRLDHVPFGLFFISIFFISVF